jgi:sporulation protein YlmC with PRC-barrel domain
MMRIEPTALAMVVLGFAWPAFAQTEKTDKTKPVQVHEGASTMVGGDPCFVHKASDLVGIKVRNPQDEDLGDIKELVINPETGEVEYAVLSFGGFMGMGDKLFALPWGVLEPVHNMKDGDKQHLVLSVDKERLKTSPGFPKDNWPDMNSPDWAQSIRDFYEEDLKSRRTGSSESVSAGKAIDASKRYHLVKASELKGTNVKTSDDKDAGEISELAIDPTRGRVAYFILSSGGFLGFGKDKYVLPWQACSISVDKDNDLVCKLTVPQSKFEKAPDYVDNDWKRMSDPVFVREVYTYYGTPVYWKDSDLAEAGSKKPVGTERNP